MANNDFSFNKYDNKVMVNSVKGTVNSGKNFIKIIVIISFISTLLFFVVTFLFSDDNSAGNSTPEDCKKICNGSFSISNGNCVCSN